MLFLRCLIFELAAVPPQSKEQVNFRDLDDIAGLLLVDDSRTGAAIGVKEPVHVQNVSGGATVENVEVEPTPFSLLLMLYNVTIPQSLDPLTVGIGVKYRPSRRGKIDEHSEVVLECSSKD